MKKLLQKQKHLQGNVFSTEVTTTSFLFRKLHILLVVLLLWQGSACQPEHLVPERSIPEHPIPESLIQANLLAQQSATSPVNYTQTLVSNDASWYYQLSPLSDAALKANGFTSNLPTIKTNCQNKGCTAAATMTSLNILGKMNVNETNFVSICKSYGITGGSYGSIDNIVTYLKSYYKDQTSKFTKSTAKNSPTLEVQLTNYIKTGLNNNKPAIVRVRWSENKNHLPSTKGAELHFVSLVGLKLYNVTEANPMGDTTTGLVFYLDSGTQDLTGKSHLRYMKYNDFLAAMTYDGVCAVRIGN